MENVYIDTRQYQDYFIGKWLEKRHKKDLISLDELIGDLEDLICDVEHLEEIIENKKGE